VTRNVLVILCLGSLVTGTYANTVKGAGLKHDPNRALKNGEKDDAKKDEKQDAKKDNEKGDFKKDDEKECEDKWFRSKPDDGRCWNKKACKCPEKD